jgi:hypothetical protein
MRRFWTNRTLRNWLLAWAGASFLGVANGATRELVYKDQVGETTANQISVATLIALLTLYFWALERRWPLGTNRDALSVGAIWVALTIVFEFGFGHYVDGDTWEELFSNYDVSEGNLWLLILAWIGMGPASLRALAASRVSQSPTLHHH